MGTSNFSHNEILAIKAPDKRIEIFDEGVKGLGLRVTPAGSKSFFYRYRVGDHKIRRYKIGNFPGIGLSEARKIARELKVQVNNGEDPQATKEKKKAAHSHITTFADLCDRFKVRHIPSLREKTQIEYKRIIDKELIPVLGKKAVDDITRKEIVDLLDSIAIDRGLSTFSNRVRATLSSIFSFGIDKAIVESNPVLNVKRKNKEKKRDRVYTIEEVRILWAAFEEQNEPVQSIYKMLLICGQRSGETRRMKWVDINFDKQLWRIPEEQTKASRSHIVPLPEMAIQLLDNLKPLTGKSMYVFQSRTKKNKPTEWLQKANLRVREYEDKEKEWKPVKDFRIHDLRRTMASYLAELGTNRTVLGKVLNHKGLAGDDQVTAIYDRYDYLDEKRKALNLWGRKLQNIISGQVSTKIHKIRG